jgi:hypothetical protein
MPAGHAMERLYPDWLAGAMSIGTPFHAGCGLGESLTISRSRERKAPSVYNQEALTFYGQAMRSASASPLPSMSATPVGIRGTWARLDTVDEIR